MTPRQNLDITNQLWSHKLETYHYSCNANSDNHLDIFLGREHEADEAESNLEAKRY